jgi:hypothetical protein
VPHAAPLRPGLQEIKEFRPSKFQKQAPHIVILQPEISTAGPIILPAAHLQDLHLQSKTTTRITECMQVIVSLQLLIIRGDDLIPETYFSVTLGDCRYRAYTSNLSILTSRFTYFYSPSNNIVETCEKSPATKYSC